ncbi:hypothetical protein HK097_001353, partial [Rhizophlyctis rosea]
MTVEPSHVPGSRAGEARESVVDFAERVLERVVEGLFEEVGSTKGCLSSAGSLDSSQSDDVVVKEEDKSSIVTTEIGIATKESCEIVTIDATLQVPLSSSSGDSSRSNTPSFGTDQSDDVTQTTVISLSGPDIEPSKEDAEIDAPPSSPVAGSSGPDTESTEQDPKMDAPPSSAVVPSRPATPSTTKEDKTHQVSPSTSERSRTSTPPPNPSPPTVTESAESSPSTSATSASLQSETEAETKTPPNLTPHELELICYRMSAAALYVAPDRYLALEELDLEVRRAYILNEGLPELMGGDEDQIKYMQSLDSGPVSDPPSRSRSRSATPQQTKPEVKESKDKNDAPSEQPQQPPKPPQFSPIPPGGLRRFLSRFHEVRVDMEGKQWYIGVTESSPYLVCLCQFSKLGQKKGVVKKAVKMHEGWMMLARSAFETNEKRKTKRFEDVGRRVLTDGDPLPEVGLSERAAERWSRMLMPKYKELLPTNSVAVDRKRFLAKIQGIINRHYYRMGITAHLYGSSVNNLGFPSSDVDISLVVPNMDDPQDHEVANMYRLACVLRKNGMKDVVPVPHARVPICKFHDPEYALDCDINCGNKLGLHNSRLMWTYTMLDARIRPLCMLVKLWAKTRDINDSSLGTISSYAWCLMVLNFLQVKGYIPSLQTICKDLPRRILLVPQHRPSIWEKGNSNLVFKNGHVRTKFAPTLPPAPDSSDDEIDGFYTDVYPKKEKNKKKEEPADDTDSDDPDVTEIKGEVLDSDITDEGLIRTDITFLENLNHPVLGRFKLKKPEAEAWNEPDGVVQLFYQFLRYYGWEYVHKSSSIVSVRTGTCITGGTPQLKRWRARGGFVLVIEDPFQLEKNCAGTARNVPRIVNEFRRAVRVMSDAGGKVESGEETMDGLLGELLKKVE